MLSQAKIQTPQQGGFYHHLHHQSLPAGRSAVFAVHKNFAPPERALSPSVPSLNNQRSISPLNRSTVPQLQAPPHRLEFRQSGFETPQQQQQQQQAQQQFFGGNQRTALQQLQNMLPTQQQHVRSNSQQLSLQPQSNLFGLLNLYPSPPKRAQQQAQNLSCNNLLKKGNSAVPAPAAPLQVNSAAASRKSSINANAYQNVPAGMQFSCQETGKKSCSNTTMQQSRQRSTSSFLTKNQSKFEDEQSISLQYSEIKTGNDTSNTMMIANSSKANNSSPSPLQNSRDNFLSGSRAEVVSHDNSQQLTAKMAQENEKRATFFSTEVSSQQQACTDSKIEQLVAALREKQEQLELFKGKYRREAEEAEKLSQLVYKHYQEQEEQRKHIEQLQCANQDKLKSLQQLERELNEKDFQLSQLSDTLRKVEEDRRIDSQGAGSVLRSQSSVERESTRALSELQEKIAFLMNDNQRLKEKNQCLTDELKAQQVEEEAQPESAQKYSYKIDQDNTLESYLRQQNFEQAHTIEELEREMQSKLQLIDSQADTIKRLEMALLETQQGLLSQQQQQQQQQQQIPDTPSSQDSDLALQNRYLRKAFEIKNREVEEQKTKYRALREEVKQIMLQYEEYKKVIDGLQKIQSKVHDKSFDIQGGLERLGGQQADEVTHSLTKMIFQQRLLQTPSTETLSAHQFQSGSSCESKQTNTSGALPTFIDYKMQQANQQNSRQQLSFASVTVGASKTVTQRFHEPMDCTLSVKEGQGRNKSTLFEEAAECCGENEVVMSEFSFKSVGSPRLASVDCGNQCDRQQQCQEISSVQQKNISTEKKHRNSQQQEEGRSNSQQKMGSVMYQRQRSSSTAKSQQQSQNNKFCLSHSEEPEDDRIQHSLLHEDATALQQHISQLLTQENLQKTSKKNV